MLRHQDLNEHLRVHMKRVLIATDGSDHALKAAELGAELAIKMDGAELHILAVAYYEPSEEVELRQVRANRAPGRQAS